MTRILFVLCLLALGFSCESRASFPSRLMVQFKSKMSCRDVRKILKPIHLYVNCQFATTRSSEFLAEYLGQEPLAQVIATLSANEKVLGVAPGDEAPETTPKEESKLAPVQSSLY